MLHETVKKRKKRKEIILNNLTSTQISDKGTIPPEQPDRSNKSMWNS